VNMLQPGSLGSFFVGLLVVLGIYGMVAFLRRPKPEKADIANWRPLEALGITVFVYFAAYFLSQLILGAGVGLYANMQHKSLSNMSSMLEGSVSVQFFASFLFYGLIALFVFLFLRLRRTAWKVIGFVRPQWRDIAYALMGFVAYFAGYIILLQIVQVLAPGINLDQKQEIGFSTSSTGGSLLFVFASLVILPPLMEETLTRGVLYTGLRTKLPMVGAAIITSIMFASAHLQAGSGNGLLWVAAIDTFSLSLVLVYLREKTGSLWPCIGLHGLKNLIAFMALFVFHLS
jgi:membrane protease YdiL (CAAX protease family)